MRYLSIKNFEQYQHYKDRRPPWIKLHVSLLDDYEFGQLSDVSKAHLMLLWALASKHDNKIPHDLAWITQRIAASDAIDLDELILRGFLEPHDEKRAAGKLEGWASRYVSAQTRAALFSAANNKCAACGASEKLEIDHIKPISKGGTGDVSNLQVLCRQCNRRKRALLAEQEAGTVRSDLLRRGPACAQPETEREAERESKRKKNTDSDESESKVSKLTALPKVSCDRLHSTWNQKFGAMDYTRFRKAILPIFEVPAEQRPSLDEADAAIVAAWEWWIEQDDRDQGFFNLAKFVEQFGKWRKFGAMPLIDPVRREPTERGNWAGSKALRQKSRRAVG